MVVDSSKIFDQLPQILKLEMQDGIKASLGCRTFPTRQEHILSVIHKLIHTPDIHIL